MNVLDFQKMKDEGRKISMVTCYDYSSARAVAESSIDCILVGDSVAMTMQARTNAAVKVLASEARELENAGCFALVLECVPAEAARQVTNLVKIPTIGIGAGPGVSGQVLVYQDMIGLNPGFKPKFLRTYANAFDIIQAALNAYDQDVKSGRFPNDNESYSQIHQFNRGVA